MKLTTPVIPSRQTLCRTEGDGSLDLKAICIFTAIGFFLEKDTYYNDQIALQPATEYELDENNFITKEFNYWQWQYEPRDITLKQATEEFADLYERIIRENLSGKKIILPLSGGLDSRTQAAALDKDMRVNAYSYKFENSFDETSYGKRIAEESSFPFHEYIIGKGYLWKVIDEAGRINKCYADFTNPRQMAVIDKLKELGDIFFAGHWGDVLFDDVGVGDDISFDDQIKALKKKLMKRGGAELADSLWKVWKLEGSFDEYFTERLKQLLKNIRIENPTSRIRAFKSIYWAPRWTSINMEIFSTYRDVYLPYYSDEMCRFISAVPEQHLAGRQIQINYIKMKAPKLAEIPWQQFDPLNLYTYTQFENRSRLGVRAVKKIRRVINEKLLNNKKTTRNWEIQFCGKENDQQLRRYLFENKKFESMVPSCIVRKFYDKFTKEDEVYYSHPVNMLLTLSVFAKLNLNVPVEN